MSVLISIVVFVFAFHVIMKNKPVSFATFSKNAKANVAVAAIAVLIVLLSNLTNPVLGLVSLALLWYRQKVINFVFLKLNL